jgi:DsbC/DsbD-like thiol-disulfide interchange protein
MSVDSEPAAAKPSLQSLEQLLHHRAEPGSNFYMQAPGGSGAPLQSGMQGQHALPNTVVTSGDHHTQCNANYAQQ